MRLFTGIGGRIPQMKKRQKKIGRNDADLVIDFLWWIFWLYIALVLTLPWIEIINRILK